MLLGYLLSIHFTYYMWFLCFESPCGDFSLVHANFEKVSKSCKPFLVFHSSPVIVPYSPVTQRNQAIQMHWYLMLTYHSLLNLDSRTKKSKITLHSACDFINLKYPWLQVNKIKQYGFCINMIYKLKWRI